jgi:LacI family transcriptional regulator
VDGLILAHSAGTDPNALAAFAEQETPLVLMDRLGNLPFDQVGIENRQPTMELVGHLAAQGHQRILLIAGDTRVSTLRERFEAFTEAVSASGLEISQQTTITAERTELVEAQICDALNSEERPTAIIACSTVLAAIALRIVQQRGLRLSQDIAFAVFDGFAYSDLFEPSLTTVRQPAFDIGVAAAELLIRRIGDKLAEPETVRLTPTIEYRSSTGSAPTL